LEYEKALVERERKSGSDADSVKTKKAELDEREREIEEREYELAGRIDAFNKARREFNAARYNAEFATTSYGGYGYSPAPTPAPAPATDFAPAPAATAMDFDDLKRQAGAEGIRIKTAGKSATVARTETVKGDDRDFINKGLGLFKSAVIILCIIIAESLAVFFLKDKLQVSGIYPTAFFAAGFLLFLVCTIMYVSGYKNHARRSKHATYILTAAILFVISVIIIAMIAVYLKADLKQPMELITHVLIPVAFTFNILLFAVFFHFLTAKRKH
jgi:hypothetical protein